MFKNWFKSNSSKKKMAEIRIRAKSGGQDATIQISILSIPGKKFIVVNFSIVSQIFDVNC